jgi:hypothetical protein
MPEPHTSAIAHASAPVAAGTAAAAAAFAGIDDGHLVAGVFGGVVSLWFTPGAGWWRSWLSVVAGVSTAVWGAPVAAIILAQWSGLPRDVTGNLAALMLGAFATDLLTGARGVIKVLPAWIYERLTGRELSPETCATCEHLRRFGPPGAEYYACDLRRPMSDHCDEYKPRAPHEQEPPT